MKNLKTHIRIVFAVMTMILLANIANAQKDSTKVIDNKGTIKFVLSTKTKFVDSASNGLHLDVNAKGDSTVKLGGNLTEATVITTNGHTLTFNANGDSLYIKGLGRGTTNDSIVVQDATSGALRRIAVDSLLSALKFGNGLTKVGDSVFFGGNLTKNTIITTGGNGLIINVSGGATDSLAIKGLQKLDDVQTAATQVVVVDSVTGKVSRTALTNLVQSGESVYTTGSTSNGTTAFDMGTNQAKSSGTDLPNAGIATASRVWVYRNGAKLVAGVDYTIASNNVHLQPSIANGWSDTTGDVYEVQWIQ